MNISILVDDKKSWFVKYAQILKEKLSKKEHTIVVVNDSDKCLNGGICFLLSCTKIVNNNFLKMHEHNIVVHASDLPSGKGFTPWRWQISEGKSDIVLTLFEVEESVDAGPYYFKDIVHFDGTELLDDIQHIIAEKIIEMCVTFADNYERYIPQQQTGIESFYPRPSKENDRLDINKTIAEQFDHFRIADNENYPLWFEIRGKRYKVKIYYDT